MRFSHLIARIFPAHLATIQPVKPQPEKCRCRRRRLERRELLLFLDGDRTHARVTKPRADGRATRRAHTLLSIIWLYAAKVARALCHFTFESTNGRAVFEWAEFRTSGRPTPRKGDENLCSDDTHAWARVLRVFPGAPAGAYAHRLDKARQTLFIVLFSRRRCMYSRSRWIRCSNARYAWRIMLRGTLGDGSAYQWLLCLR